MAEGPRDHHYAYYATFSVIIIQLLVTLGIWVIPGHRPWWIWVLIACEVVAVTIGGFTMKEFVFSNVLDLVGRRVLRTAVSPGFGLVGKRLSDTEIRNAFPSGYPPEGRGDHREDTGLSADSARRAAWAETLQRANGSKRSRERAPRPFVTTIGLVRLRRQGVKLAVVNYFRPRHLLRAWLSSDSTIKVAGEMFPIVARPWLPVRHSGTKAIDGHCWVTFGKEPARCGVVTARHVIQPGNFEVGAAVDIETSRSAIKGKLRQSSVIMDAALIEVNDADKPDLIPTPCTDIIGFKPVRMATGSHHDYGPVEGRITGLPGLFNNGIYLRQPGNEPVMPAIMTFNIYGRHGDSGCLVLDIEGEEHGYTAPYLIYQGVINLGRGKEGYGLFLGQVVAQWSVTIHSSASSGTGVIEQRHSPGLDLEPKFQRSM
jgi:hypothetical protein